MLCRGICRSKAGQVALPRHRPSRHSAIGGKQPFIAGLLRDCLSRPWVIDTAMNRAAFEALSRPNSLEP